MNRRSAARRVTPAVATAALLAQALLLAAPQPPPPPISLPYANSYLVTGNYVVGGVDLAPASGGNGFLTGTINMSGVPQDAEVLSAFLYWETIAASPAQLAGAQFRGQSIDMSDANVVQVSPSSLSGSTASCYSSGSGLTMFMVRADVRRLLPRELDATGKPTGRRLVNDDELQTNIDPETDLPYPPHTVTLPESGTGNVAPQSAGASLVVVYRDPSEPLRKIVLYDGIAVLPDIAGAKLAQTIRGIYQSGPNKSARLTHIVGGGAPNQTERVFFKGAGAQARLRSNPFLAHAKASDRSWTSLTFDEDDFIEQPSSSTVSSLMPGATNPADGFGEFVTTTVEHGNASPYDCLSWAAIIFSTTVKDLENDGIPDGLEDARRRSRPRRRRNASCPTCRRSAPVQRSETSSSRWTR